MHPMMIDETIRSREEEASKVAEQNRLVAIALEGQPGHTNGLIALPMSLFLKAARWAYALSGDLRREVVEN